MNESKVKIKLDKLYRETADNMVAKMERSFNEYVKNIPNGHDTFENVIRNITKIVNNGILDFERTFYIRLKSGLNEKERNLMDKRISLYISQVELITSEMFSALIGILKKKCL